MVKPDSRTTVRIVKCFRHWRSKKMIYASAYGKKGFPIKVKR